MHTDNPGIGPFGGGATAGVLSGVCASIEVLGVRDRVSDVRNAFDFDMGRTTADSGTVLEQQVTVSAGALIARYPLAQTETVSAEAEAVLDDLVGIADAQAYCVMAHGDFVSGVVSLATWHPDRPAPGEDKVPAELLRDGPGLPALAVDERLFEHVQAHSRLRGYVAHVDPVDTLFRRFAGTYQGRHLVFRYLDYIRICLESVDWADSPQRVAAFKVAASGVERERIVTEGIAASVQTWFIAHAARIVFAHEQASGPDRDGYIWLAGYHNAMVSVSGAHPDCRCVLDAG